MSQRPVKITQIATKSTQLIRKPIPSQLNNNLGNKPGPIPYFATKSAPPPETTECITKIIPESPITPQVLPKNAIKTTEFPNLLQELENQQNKNKLLPSLRPYHETIISKLKEERLPKLKSTEVGWKTGNSTLPPGWKIRTHFWWDREKQTFMAPDGRIFGSRKAVLKQMEAEGSYDLADFEKVRRGLKRKGRKKPTCQKKEEGIKMIRNDKLEKEEERKLESSQNMCDERKNIVAGNEVERKDEIVIQEVSKTSEIQDSEVGDNKKMDQSEKGKIEKKQPSESEDNNEIGAEKEQSKVGKEKCKKQSKCDSVAERRKSNENEKVKNLKSKKSVSLKGLAIGGSLIDIEEEFDNVVLKEIEEDEVDIEEELDNVGLKEIEEDEIMNDAEEVEILQLEKKIKLMSESNKVRPCFVKIFRLPNTQIHL